MIDVRDRARDAVDHAHREDRVEILGRPIVFGRGERERVERARFGVAANLAAGRVQIGEDRRQVRGRDGAIDQQRFGRAADAGAPHLGVER